MSSSTPTNPAIDFYLSEVDARIAEKQRELEKALEKSQNVRVHAETIQNFIGKLVLFCYSVEFFQFISIIIDYFDNASRYANFESRVKDFQAEIEEMDRQIQEKQREIDENRNFSRREEVQMAKLMEKLEKVTEERKQKERTLLKLYEEEGKTLEEDEDSDDEDSMSEDQNEACGRAEQQKFDGK
ncbi:hypothetical protein CAEBREN_20741 [Caenorhabditis brenneri]|uniref:Uncharacterized protein n=1 Tax=Caenorhabditis brenneri TaxID=135651 RepID=G0MCB2_CAEBE|nr:hypothetical protein CAEBREN_20741 [Caenorhabditis brenneri]